MIKPIPDYPALTIKIRENKNLLIIADLHLGFEIELASYGIMIPSQTRKIMNGIIKLINDYSPSKVILLGDVKHEIAKISYGEWVDVPQFMDELIKKRVDIEVVLGNHDGNLEPLTPRSVTIHSSRGILVKTAENALIGLIHGHAWPSEKLFKADTIVMGHLHPLIELRDKSGFKFSEPVWVKIEFPTSKLVEGYLNYRRIKFSEPISAFKDLFGFTPKTRYLIIMPAFNVHLGGAIINKDIKKSSFIGPVSDIALSNRVSSEVYLLDGTFLGSINSLKMLL